MPIMRYILGSVYVGFRFVVERSEDLDYWSRMFEPSRCASMKRGGSQREFPTFITLDPVEIFCSVFQI